MSKAADRTNIDRSYLERVSKTERTIRRASKTPATATAALESSRCASSSANPRPGRIRLPEKPPMPSYPVPLVPSLTSFSSRLVSRSPATNPPSLRKRIAALVAC